MTKIEEEATKNQNSYEVIAKRLRTLKKRVTKIEKYEEDIAAGLKDKLNEDQVLAVQKKGEVVVMIKELEEISKIMADKDAEVGTCVAFSLC